jgi:hypothetical protein
MAMTMSQRSDKVFALVLVAGLVMWHPPSCKRRLSLAELRALAASAGFVGADADRAASIAMRESGGDPCAINDTRGKTHPPGITDELSIGLWQINTLSSPQWSVGWLKDPTHNAAAAYQLFRRNGWAPWKLTAGQ